VEITSVAWEVGYWRFSVRDAASYFGLGERFDTLDHAHTWSRTCRRTTGESKALPATSPIPFFMEHQRLRTVGGYHGEATFDLNAGDNSEIVVDVTAAKLRIVLFPGGVSRNSGAVYRAGRRARCLPPYWAFAPWKARDYYQERRAGEGGRRPQPRAGLPASVIVIDSPWETTYNDYKFNPKQFDDAPAMVKYIHAQGYKLVLWHTPWINNKSDPRPRLASPARLRR